MTATYEAKGKIKKVVLLYSGGLDTSVMVKWLQEKYNAEVITLTVDLGQPGINMEKIKDKALKIGASKAYIIDAKEEFADKYIAPGIKANALYQGKYPLSTALGRPLIAKLAVETAKKEGADAVAHGCTGKGNDQVRLDASIITLDPDMKIIAPVREWDMTRDAELEYAKKHGIEVSNNNKKYSTDENLWGKSSECGILEHPEEEPPADVFNFVTLPENAPDKAEHISIEFESGVPVALNSIKAPLYKIITALNSIAGKHGIGIIDHMEDRIVGLKSREIYECPAAACILTAHKDLEKYVSTIHENTFKPVIDEKWSYMAYAGLWFDPLMKDLNGFIGQMNQKVTGTVKLKLYKGSAAVVGRESANAIYDLKLASYNTGHTFNQAASPGFIELWSLQSKVANNITKGQEGEKIEVAAKASAVNGT